MPIHQHRLLSLINAARAYEGRFEDIRTSIAAAKRLIANGTATYEEAFNLIANEAASSFIPAKHIEAVAKEEQHFKLTHKRNEKNRNHMAGKRIVARALEDEERITANWLQKQAEIRQAVKDGTLILPPRPPKPELPTYIPHSLTPAITPAPIEPEATTYTPPPFKPLDYTGSDAAALVAKYAKAADQDVTRLVDHAKVNAPLSASEIEDFMPEGSDGDANSNG